jgi:hypothetical protein
MYFGILPQIDAGEMKTERVGCAAKVAQPAAPERRRAVCGERAIKNVEVGDELRSPGIRRRLAYGVAQRLGLLQCPCRRRQPRIDAGDRLAIGLVAAA